MTTVRSVNYLSSVGSFRVFGNSKAADTSAALLLSLGASVERHRRPFDIATVGRTNPGDVVICDLVRSGVAASYGRDVAERNGGVWVTISAFGLDGPYGGRSGSDLVCAAAGGLLGAVADDDRRSYPLPGGQAVQVAGQMAVLAALQGISMTRERPGAVHLDVSAQEAVAFCSVQQEAAHLLYECTGRAGVSRYSSPSGHFRCADGDLEIIVLDDEQWRRISRALGRDNWPDEYPTLLHRQTSRKEIDQAVTEWTSTRGKIECEAILQEHGVPAVAVRTLEEVASLAQFHDRDFLPDEMSNVLRTKGLPAAIDVEDQSSVGPSAEPGLSAFRVVEATNVLVAPLAGAMMGAMGATVVRLENTNRLDIYRRNGPFQHGVPDQEAAAYFLVANYCKRSVSHDFEHDNDYARRIARWGDLLLENVGERALSRIGLGEGDRDQVGNAFVSISGFGRNGPCAGYKAYAGNVHAFAGLDWVVSQISGSKGRVRCAFADYCAAVWGATLATAWWLGSRVSTTFDLSMAEVVADKLNGSSLETGYPGTDEQEDGVLICCPDEGQIAIAGSKKIDVRQLLDAIGLDATPGGLAPGTGITVLDLRDDPEVPSSEELLSRIAKSELPVTAYPVQRPPDIMTDEQLDARGFLVGLDHPKVGRAPVLALPWKEAFTARVGYRRAPLLGEDNAWMEATLSKVR